MPWLRRSPNSPFWIAIFRLPDGRETNRSTGTTNKKEALKIALKFEEAADTAKQGRLTETRARRTIADIYSLGNKETLPDCTIGDFLTGWTRRKAIEAEERTAERYGVAVRHALAFLGAKASKDLTHLSAKDITALRDSLAEKLSPASANFTVKTLRAALNQARRDGLVDTNEASRVTLIQRRRTSVERRPFTLGELRKILAVADEEWRGIILVALYTGLRLGDVATLTWANLDLMNREISVTTQKTQRRQVLPIAGPLLRHLEGLPAADLPGAPVFPEAYATRMRNKHSGTLSNQFRAILVAAGLSKPMPHRSVGKGRSARREKSELSFHCLRHTATSLLKNAGVSDVVARDIIGHETEAVSRHYTHIDMETKRRAVEKMPDVLR